MQIFVNAMQNFCENKENLKAKIKETKTTKKNNGLKLEAYRDVAKQMERKTKRKTRKMSKTSMNLSEAYS